MIIISVGLYYGNAGIFTIPAIQERLGFVSFNVGSGFVVFTKHIPIITTHTQS